VAFSEFLHNGMGIYAFGLVMGTVSEKDIGSVYIFILLVAEKIL
jgi:hypothetical protein